MLLTTPTVPQLQKGRLTFVANLTILSVASGVMVKKLLLDRVSCGRGKSWAWSSMAGHVPMAFRESSMKGAIPHCQSDVKNVLNVVFALDPVIRGCGESLLLTDGSNWR
jgi:hypothetical protein